MPELIWSDPLSVLLLQWLARGSLKQNLAQAIRLWVGLQLLYGKPANRLALPEPFGYADWRDAFFTTTHPRQDEKPMLHDRQCPCAKVTIAWLFGDRLSVSQPEWEKRLKHPDDHQHIQERSRQFQQSLQQYDAVPDNLSALLWQTRLFGMTRRTLANDLQRLADIGWLKREGNQYNRVKQFPTRPLGVAELGQTIDGSNVTLWISQLMLSTRAMYTRPSIEQTEPPRSPKETLPTMYDLPSDNAEKPGLPDEFHYLQPQLLSATFRLTDYSREQIFTSGDLNLYYDSRHPLWYKRPDWFAAVGVPRLYKQRDLRLSYVVWQEGVSPIAVVEFLSPGTENEDLGKATRSADQPPSKWELYEQILRIPYYAVFDRYTDQLRAFTLMSGQYQELELSESRFWMPALKLGLGLWQGEYGDVERRWLRWYDAAGNWILTKAERLAERLRSMGVDPDEDI